MKLTKKFIKENAGMTLKEAFSGVFKTVLETGVWYYSKTKNGTFENLFRTDEGVNCYGFENKKYVNCNNINYLTKNNLRPATNEEVLEALSNEAVKRGYRNGVLLISCESVEMKPYGQFVYCGKTNRLYFGGATIMKNGQWATIIQPKQMTIQEIEKEFNIQVV